MLTGRLIFEGLSGYETLLEQVNTPPVPPSHRTETAIPPELERIIMACLEKDPNKRPQTASELMASLKAVSLPASWTPYRAEHWWQAHHPTSRGQQNLALPRMAGEAA